LLRRVSVIRVAAGVFASATSFFLLSNFSFFLLDRFPGWGGINLYPHTLAGLQACFVAALPFYGYDLVSTGVFAAIFFGTPVLAKRFISAMHAAEDRRLA
jgi:hypothetical protein